MKSKNKKTLFTLVAGLVAFLAIIFTFQTCNAQAAEPDTAYMVSIDENGDSTCFILVDTTKGEIDCKTAMQKVRAQTPVTPAPTATVEPAPTPTPEAGPKSFFEIAKMVWAFIAENWYILILPLLEIVVRLIPGEKDNNILRIIQSWLDKVIPNKRVGGGRFVAYEDKESAPALGVVVKKNIPKDEQ